MPRRFLAPACLVAVLGLSLFALAQAAEGKKHALVVGVTEYESRHFPRLRFTENDAEKLAALLKAQGFAVRLLTNARGEKDKADLPTAANIRKELEQVCEGKTRRDLVLLAFSGHGIQLEVADPDEKEKARTYGYFCPMDASLAAKVSFSTGRCDKLVSLNDTMEQLGKCDAGSKFVLLDACRNEMKATAVSRSADPSAVKVPAGVGVLFSCKSGEKSFEVEKLKHGLFFHHVLEGLRGEAKNKRGEVTWSRLVAHVKDEVKANAAEAVGGGAAQVPFSSGVEVADAVLMRDKAAADNLVTNSIGMKLAFIPAGEFWMGSPAGEKERGQDEKQHKVRITKAFRLGVHTVTQSQFKEVMGYNPSFFSKDGTKRDLDAKYFLKPADGKDEVKGIDTSGFPVENVSWHEAAEFCEKLSARIGEKEKGRLYRLPTEAEWEYSCRGPAAPYKPFHFGDELNGKQANCDGDSPYGTAEKGPYLKRTCKVGSYKENGFGLFDMHGNVSEWCSDWDGDYPDGPVSDPTGPEKGAGRALRGGSWDENGRNCRSASRNRFVPASRYVSIGFRVALVPVR